MREFSFLANEGLDGLTGIVSCVDPPSRKWGGGKLKEGGWGWKIWPGGGGGANFKHTFREPKYRLWLFFLSGTSYEFPYHEAGNPDVLICSDLFHRQRGNWKGRKRGREGDVFCPSFLWVLLLFKKSDSLLPVGEISLRPLLPLLLLLFGDCCCCCWASHVGGKEEGKYWRG